jgi:hypothetical protein
MRSFTASVSAAYSQDSVPAFDHRFRAVSVSG